jgi:hypothetical protein
MMMNNSPPSPAATLEDTTSDSQPLLLAHDEFRAGVPAGRFNLIVNPERAQRYVKHRLFVVQISLPLLGIGAALAMSGYPWVGAPLVLVGMMLHRVIKAHATKILLHLALSDAKTYFEAMEFAILEVRRREPAR